MALTGNTARIQTNSDQDHDAMIVDLLSDREEIFINPAILNTAHMRMRDEGVYEPNDVLLKRFSCIMSGWCERQPMLRA